MSTPSRSDSSSGNSTPYTQAYGSSGSSSAAADDLSAERCSCRLPGCNKSYNRIYDLVRHLTSGTHRAHFLALPAHTLDDAILAAGVPPAHLSRVQQLLGRENRCGVCGAVFSRADALRRHVVEMNHTGTSSAPGAPYAAAGWMPAAMPIPGAPVRPGTPAAYTPAPRAGFTPSGAPSAFAPSPGAIPLAYPQAYAAARGTAVGYGHAAPAYPHGYGVPAGYGPPPPLGHGAAPGQLDPDAQRLYEETMALWFGQHGHPHPGAPGSGAGPSGGR